MNAVDCFQPSSSVRVNIWYAKGTCWWLHAGRRPTLWIIPANPRAVYEPREKPKIQMRSPASSTRGEEKNKGIAESTHSFASGIRSLLYEKDEAVNKRVTQHQG